MSSFNLSINASTSFKKTAYNTKTFKLTASFRKYVRDNEGFYEGFDLLKGRGLAFNPATRRIVERKTLYTKPKKNRPTKPRIRYEKAVELSQDIKIEKAGEAIGNQVTFNVLDSTTSQIEKLINKLNTNKSYLLTIGQHNGDVAHYTLNNELVGRLLELLENTVTSLEDTSTQGSDEQIVEYITKAKYFKLKQIKPSKKSQGAFFKYTTKYELPDVEKYGIFTTVKSENYVECCFIQALRCSQMVSVEKVEAIKHQVKNAFLPMCKIKNICEQFDLHINVRGLTNTHNVRRYGNKELPEITIGLFDQHYFFIEKTQITRYALNNYELLQSLTLSKPWNHYYTKGKTDPKRCVDTLTLFKSLLNDNKALFLEPIKMSAEIMNTPHHQKINEFPALFCEKEYEPAVNHEHRKEKIKAKEWHQESTTRVWFDFETSTDGIKHVPYLCCYVDDKGTKRTFYGRDCGLQLMNDLHKKHHNKKKKDTAPASVTMFAHNLTYDFLTGIAEHLHIKSTIEKGSRIMMACGTFYGLNIKLQDSYALITAPLAKFGKMFKLDQEKEVIPYDVYTEERMKNKQPMVEMAECLQALKESEKNQFVNNCEKWGVLSGGLVDIVKYSAIYCMADCDVLKKGYMKFGEMIKSVCGLDVNNYISNASIADDFLVSRGCFDGCVNLNGITRAFIQKCLVGGRTMCANNEKQKQTAKGTKISDFDAVSLYPSAMKRLNGFLLGAPQLVEGEMTNYENLKNTSGYYIRAKITKVKTHREFPLLSYHSKEGVRIFSNDMQGKTVFIDNVALEDAVEFQGVEFEIIDGYYFNNGFNPTIINVIQEVFQARLDMKKQKNPVEQIYKLIMNSSYGKTCLKEINEKYDYVKNEDFEEFMSRRYNWIKKAVKCENGHGYRITSTNPINDHHNRVHIGIQILSMSKRIMNEVMATAEDNEMPIYYQDTDSMHIKCEDVEKLQKVYNKKYGRELIGIQMGQFHTDFELDGCKDIYSEKFIALGKKCYIDCLVGTDEKTGEEKRGHHIRLKGVPNGSILGYAKNNKKRPYQIYDKMYKGGTVTFDLLQNEHGKRIRFKKNDNMTFSTVQQFKRTIKFN
tara:strand:- start:2109 stop:5378 length:3270 start_codon:yes stop_codon:yes gene_type:complete